MDLQVNSIFKAIQGEGVKVGTPELFIRFQGCRVKCTTCDTPEARGFKDAKTKKKLGKKMSVDDIIKAVIDSGCTYITLTGGEPLNQNEEALADLMLKLNRRRKRITLETSGQYFIDDMLQADFLSVDIKTPSSGVVFNEKVFGEIVDYFFDKMQVKLVIKDKKDYKFALKMYRKFIERLNYGHFILTPCWEVKDDKPDTGFVKKLGEWMHRDRMDKARLIVQQHKVIHGHKPGT